MFKVKEHGLKGELFAEGVDGHKIGTIAETFARGKALAEEMGIDHEQFKRLWFIVTDKGVPMVIETLKGVDVNNIHRVLKQHNINPIILHSHWFTGIVTNRYTEDNKDHFWKYTANATINRSPEDVVRNIINDSDGITQLFNV